MGSETAPNWPSARRWWSWPGVRRWRSWPELRDGGTGQSSETAELARARRRRARGTYHAQHCTEVPNSSDYLSHFSLLRGLLSTCSNWWPWHFLSMPLTAYFNYAYENILTQFKPWESIIPVPGPETSKRLILSFDPTLTSNVTSTLSSLKCFGWVLWRAFECRLARLSTTNGSRDSRGRHKPTRHSRVRQ